MSELGSNNTLLSSSEFDAVFFDKKEQNRLDHEAFIKKEVERAVESLVSDDFDGGSLSVAELRERLIARNTVERVEKSLKLTALGLEYDSSGSLNYSETPSGVKLIVPDKCLLEKPNEFSFITHGLDLRAVDHELRPLAGEGTTEIYMPNGAYDIVNGLRFRFYNVLPDRGYNEVFSMRGEDVLAVQARSGQYFYKAETHISSLISELADQLGISRVEVVSSDLYENVMTSEKTSPEIERLRNSINDYINNFYPSS